MTIEAGSFMHVQHVGLGPTGKDFQVQAVDEAVAQQLLAALGMKVRSKEEMESVLGVLQTYGKENVSLLVLPLLF